MKSKKAGKRLDKVEALLSNVIEQYAPSQPHMLELLDSAKNSVVRAKEALDQSASGNGRKSSAKAKNPKRQMSAKGEKKNPPVHRERATPRGRKGASAEAAPVARKTA